MNTTDTSITNKLETKSLAIQSANEQIKQSMNSCLREDVLDDKKKTECFQIPAKFLLIKIKELIKAGNVRRIIIKNKKNEILLQIPLTVGVIGIMFAPILSAVGTIATLCANCTLEVEKINSKK